MLSNYWCAGEIRPDGKLYPDDRKDFDTAMWRMKRGPVVIKIEQPSRSSQANRYYWGVVLALIADHTGYETDELHEYFKKRFNPTTLALGHGEEVIGGSTRKLSVDGFREYVDRIKRFALTELQVQIPEAEAA